jgi:AcrR family transcriptional regulator
VSLAEGLLSCAAELQISEEGDRLLRNEKVDDGLTPSQSAALNALMEGKTIAAVAAAAQVSRATIHRWLKGSADFQAAYNSRRADLRTSHEAKLEAMMDKALLAIENALDNGNARVALTLLQGTGILIGKLPYIGSDDPKVVERILQHRTFTDSLTFS